MPQKPTKIRWIPVRYRAAIFAAAVLLSWWITPAFAPFILIPLFILASFDDISADVPNNVSKEDLLLIEDPEDRDLCLVAIIIYRNGQIVGRDRGVAWFTEDQLLYSGHCTSFILGGQDIVPKQPHQSSAENVLPLSVETGQAAVEFTPLLFPGTGGSTPQEMRFRKRLYDFRRNPKPTPSPRQWPPFQAALPENADKPAGNS